MPEANRKFLKPALGQDPLDPKGKVPMKVRNPATGRHLAADGEWVDLDTYWRRRIRDEDVAESSPPRPPKPAKEETAP